MILDYRNNVEGMGDYIREFVHKHAMVQSQIALDLAAGFHKDQTRDEGIPYIIHPLTMACHALSLGLMEDSMIAVILLHDVCEDCPVKADELPVSQKVRDGVDSMTFEKKEQETKEEAMERYYRKIRANREAGITKLFDRCHNVSSMSRAFSDKKLFAYIDETKKYVYPLFEHVKNRYPEFTQAVFVLEYHTKSIIEVFDRRWNQKGEV